MTSGPADFTANRRASRIPVRVGRDLNDCDPRDRTAADSPDDEQPDQAEKRMDNRPPTAAGFDQRQQGNCQKPDRLRRAGTKSCDAVHDQRPGSSYAARREGRLEDVGRRIRRRRNQQVQERPTQLEQRQAQHGDDQFSEIEGQPDRPHQPQRGEQPGQGTAVRNRHFVGHIILPVSSRLARFAVSTSRSMHVQSGSLDQGTTQVKTTAAPWGVISHWPSAAGSNNVWPKSSRTRLVAVLDIRSSRSNPSRS